MWSFATRLWNFATGVREGQLRDIRMLEGLSRGILRPFLLIDPTNSLPSSFGRKTPRRHLPAKPFMSERHGNVASLDPRTRQARRSRSGRFDRRELEAAAAYMADEDNGIGYLYSGWCQTALPHRRLPDGKGWQVQSGPVTLIVEPGMRPGPASEPVPVGVPYGSRARLILIYLQSEAIRTKSREIELGRSLRIWMGRLGISVGGLSVSAVRDQAERISRCHMTFQITKGRGSGLLKQSIVDSAMFLDDPEDRQGSLFVNVAILSEPFFAQLQRHPVPLEEAAIRGLANNSQALDIYAWLAYRLHSLPGPTPLPWRALMTQFGGGYSHLKHFKPRFLLNLRLAQAVYPEARLESDDETGLILHPSKPPVAKLLGS
jgi:Plasmid encoded RepA protein